jgi:hypothetical protein
MKSVCPGCGIELETVAGPTDPYGGASSACWKLYSESISRALAGPEFAEARRLAADAYLAQHPSRASRAAVQSVWVHLAGLYLFLVKKTPGVFIARVQSRMTEAKDEFEWLAPPAAPSALNCSVLVKAETVDDGLKAAKAWADSVWQAWSPWHGKIAETAARHFG